MQGREILKYLPVGKKKEKKGGRIGEPNIVVWLVGWLVSMDF